MTTVLPVRASGAAVRLTLGEDARSTAGRPADLGRRTVGRTAPWLVRGVMGIAVLAFAVLAVGPHVLGYRTMTMLTASMAPEIEPGDITVATPIDVTELTEGMVITYHMPVGDRSLVTHRVVSVDLAEDGSVTVQTKGDANEAVDPWTAGLEGDTVYQVRAVIPEFGHLVQLLRTPVVNQVLLYGAPALLAGWLLLTIWRPTREEETRA
ncbi:signal peptidase, endoplasmic reticulum-type [Blastococcus sp. DSM 46786]|uniref:signal peptidase I n=1 Tax=Blastococcus sp. DSM 46786 TaxID=1798227 RepID=UPI0008BB8ACD|nr:signal peptidase I [Blastococcus sp. DSM 46786]SEK84014.1 signal peptidase, endoplasmic reticulum-type [Blastococcus sp. DSM 46786]